MGPPPPADDEDLLADDREEEEKEEAVMDVIDYMLNRVRLIVDENEVQKKTISHCVNVAIESSLFMVDVCLVGREDTGVTPGALSSGSWECDDRPDPSPVDTWARGAIGLRPKPHEEVSAARTSTLRKSLPPGASQTLTGTLAETQNTSKNPPQPEFKPIPKPPKRELTKEEVDLESRLRDDIEVRKKAQELQLAQIRKDEEEVEQLDQLQKDLRGKDYGYDARGQVCVYSKYDPEKLPLQAVELDSLVRTPEDILAEELALIKVDRKAEELAAKKEAAKLREARRAAAAAQAAKEFIPPAEGTAASAVELFKMEAGVTLREGQATRTGGKRANDPEHMSKKEYTQQMGRVSDAPFNDDGSKPRSAPLSREASAGGAPLPPPPPLQAEGLSGGGLPPWAADALVYAQRPGTGEEPQEELPMVDANELLTSATDWGHANPPRSGPANVLEFPGRLSVKQREATLNSQLPSLPRDRPFAPVKLVSPALSHDTPRRRNPNAPPPFGTLPPVGA